MSEAAKIKPKIEKYLQGTIYDFGCGESPIVPEAFGIDVRDLPGVNFVAHLDYDDGGLKYHNADTIFSSHFLEHLIDYPKALGLFYVMLNHGGHLILYLPDSMFYNNRTNPEHFQSFEYEVFIRMFEKRFENLMEIVEHGPHIGPDQYSFYLVARKL